MVLCVCPFLRLAKFKFTIFFFDFVGFGPRAALSSYTYLICLRIEKYNLTSREGSDVYVHRTGRLIYLIFLKHT